MLSSAVKDINILLKKVNLLIILYRTGDRDV